jgi:predicted ATPase
MNAGGFSAHLIIRIDAGLLFCRGTAPHASYLFKHALVQDAAYSTLLRAKRQELHARVAGVLEQGFADQVERQPELLAHHLSAAGDAARAIDQWLNAGQYAAARSAHLEAIRHFERGLSTLATLPETSTRSPLSRSTVEITHSIPDQHHQTPRQHSEDHSRYREC